MLRSNFSLVLRRHIEICKAERTKWKLTFQDINATPIENKKERGCTRWQMFRHFCRDGATTLRCCTALSLPSPRAFSALLFVCSKKASVSFIGHTNMYKIRFLKRSHDAIRNNTVPVPVPVSVQTAKEECRKSKIKEFNGTYLHKFFRLLRILLHSDRHRILQCWCIKHWGHTRFVLCLHIHPYLKL